MNDKITIEITCNCETCEKLREAELFSESIADILGLDSADKN
jgi:hypothetical protein